MFLDEFFWIIYNFPNASSGQYKQALFTEMNCESNSGWEIDESKN